uniref:Uncharacterized protein n=1 Tax=Cajanus cajan TaxID=3821 RepID=A0A151SKU5_CAJCA|nr:hypothetical protein KK1_001668 [Cajanus cajan]
MPGNEVGDRVHNFFGQENLSQGQYHSQAGDGNWPGISNNLWAGSQRPTGAPFISNLKNFNQQQSDFEQGHTSSPHLRHGLNLAQSNLRPDSGRNQLPNQQTAVNGYMSGHQVFQSRQNEANILGMDTETDLHGISSLTDASESPVNYDFFGIMQGSSNGLVLPPEQLRLMGLVSNQGDQSLYGLPISGSRGTPNLYSHIQADKPAMSQVSVQHQHQYSRIQGDKSTLPHISASGHSFPVHQYASISDQTNMNDGTSVSRQEIQGKNMFGSLAQGINSGLNMENMQPVNSEQRDVPIEDFNGRQELAGSSDTSQDKVVGQVAPSQNAVTLDPTEEKILFGSDDSLWGGFGWNSGLNMLDGADSFGGVQSVQSGSWSALMQSAVAETSSSADTAQEHQDRLQTDSSQRSIPQFLERGKWLDCSPQQKPIAEGNHVYGNAANTSSLELNEKVISGGSNSIDLMDGMLLNHQHPITILREKENVLQPHHDKAMQEDMGQVPKMWEPDSDTNSSVGLEHAKSPDGLAFNSSHHRTGSLRENPSFDGDLHSPKLSGQGNRRPPITRKFQYHPMGDVGGADIEPYGNKHVINSQPMPHQPIGGLKGQDQSYPGQSKYSHSDGNYNEMEKGDSKTIDDNASKSMLPGHIPKTLTPFDRTVGNYALNNTASPSQNILELLHKVDQSREHGIATNTSTSNRPLSSRVMDTESSDGSVVHPQRNQSSLSQGFGLQLAPPTQRLPLASSHATPHVASETGDKGHTCALGNIPQTFTSGFPFSRIHTQNQNVASLGGQLANTQCDSATFVDRTASTSQVDEYCERAQTSQSELQSAPDMSQMVDASHPSVTASLQGAPSKILHNVWTSVSNKQYPNALKISPHPQQINICETTTGPQKPSIEDSEKDGNLSGQQVLQVSVDTVEEIASASHVKYTPDASQSSPAATSKDIEDFGRFLRPNNILHQNFSMLNQVQSMKNMEIDPSNRDVKRFKVSDNVMDKQQVDSNHGQQSYGYNNIVKDLSGDAQDTNASSQEMVGYGQRNALNVANNNKLTSVKSEHSMINPQMAPSWFDKYGAFKNGKTLQMHDVRTMTPHKVMEQPLIRNQSGSLHIANSVEQVNSLSVAAVEPDLSSMRPKKRKDSTSELIPWHKEMSLGSERLQDISAAEFEWAQAANRLIEKVEDDVELVEDLPMMKSKRRLVLTSQLMQQLLNAPPAAVLSSDAKSHHESVVYSVARLVLGDACSLVSWSGNDTLMSSGSKKLLPDKLKSSEKIDQCILNVENFVGRARKLENDILRLDSRASILDLRVECQDLERFSVINRFAKFHGRGQNDGAETSSSDATANAQKSCPQKYVTAVPMPRNLPDRVQCLSL